MTTHQPHRISSLIRLLLIPVAFAAVFGPIAWSRATDPFIVHVPLARSAFWGSLAAIALAEPTRRSGSWRELAALSAGYASGTLVGWLLIIPCMEALGLLIGPFAGLLIYYGLHPAGVSRVTSSAIWSGSGICSGSPIISMKQYRNLSRK